MTTETIAPKEENFESTRGLRIFYRSWRPAGTPRAVVAICHGLNAHSGQYLWAAEQLVDRGLAVYALDLRGRGKSDGERYFVERIEDYTDDLGGLIRIAKQREPGLPLFLLGHSAGGVISCIYHARQPVRARRFICEDFAFRVPAPDFALAVLKGLSHVAPHAHVLRLKNEDFSRDPEVVRAMNADPLIQNEVQPTQTVAALVRADERIERDFARFTLPLLILHGTADKVTRPDGSQIFYDKARLLGQNPQALRRPLPRPPERRRPRGGDGRHPGLDRQAPAGGVNRLLAENALIDLDPQRSLARWAAGRRPGHRADRVPRTTAPAATSRPPGAATTSCWPTAPAPRGACSRTRCATDGLRAELGALLARL